jgi:murein DD-endopeptidase MepM/ murein hydrolase activator NlpD
MRFRQVFPAFAVALAATAAMGPPVAAAPGGGGGGIAPQADQPTQTGGGTYGHSAPGAGQAPAADKPAAKRKRRSARRSRTLLTAFELRRTHLFVGGRAAKVSFTLAGRRSVAVRLHVLRAGDRERVATIDLGRLGAGDHSVPFTGTGEAGPLPEGSYLLHLAGRGLRRGAAASSTATLQLSYHRFPVAGAFDWGGAESRFGAKRTGHRHQGQDLMAAEGTPVIAPSAGLVETVQYQAQGAGHYLVLDADGEDYDFVFMHLRSGSIGVKEGDRVRTGQRVAEIGTTGSSSGAHLHFEIWAGGWFAGGAPIDPLPLLQAWASPASG